MARSARKFAEFLTEGVHRIRLRQSKTIQVVQDELGYALGREGGSAVEYWRKGHIPPKLEDVEKLAREIIQRGQLEREWLEGFLGSTAHPFPTYLCDELFPATARAERFTGPTALPPQPMAVPLPADLGPFVVGPPVVHPRLFFGRAFELKRIFGLWKRFPLQNVAIVGLRRSGKSSLLHYLKQITRTPPASLRPSQRGDWLPQPQRYRWLLVDFRDPRMCRRERLLRHLLTEMTIPVPEPCNLENFLDVVSTHLKTPTIILLDEIGEALAAPELDMPFWGSLRALATGLTGGNLAFLLTAHDAPALLAQEQGKPSPFFNIFGHTFTLGPFTEPEAHELLASSPQPFAPAEISWMLDQSERWPCRLQALAHARLTALEYGETGEGWKQEGLRQMPPY